MVKLKVVCDELARSALKDADHYIKQNSPQQEDRVKQEIIIATKKLADNPEMYPPDKYRKDRDVRFRAFEKHSYRIS